MKSPFVNELKPNQLIETSFLVQSKEIRQKKSGEFYLSLFLCDRTGELDAKMFENVSTDVLNEFDRDDFVKVKGMFQVFHNRPQLTIHKVRRMDESEVQFADYFPSSKRDAGEMWLELRAIVASMQNPHLKGLLQAMLDDEEIARRYRIAPAAKQIHHAFLGGLIEHVLSVCAMAKSAAAHYANIDYDLLITGAILHDIGKIYELNYERGFRIQRGQLIGPHLHRHADGGRQTARLAGVSAADALAGGAHDSEPSRQDGIRLAQGAAVSEALLPLSGRPGFKMEACARRSRTIASWRAVSPATARRSSAPH
jgi:3'-5' exoribonuclease